MWSIYLTHGRQSFDVTVHTRLDTIAYYWMLGTLMTLSLLRHGGIACYSDWDESCSALRRINVLRLENVA